MMYSKMSEACTHEKCDGLIGTQQMSRNQMLGKNPKQDLIF